MDSDYQYLMFLKLQNLKNIVGHSLAGSVSVYLQKNYPDRALKISTYGAPIASFEKSDNVNTKRYSNYFDPVPF